MVADIPSPSTMLCYVFLTRDPIGFDGSEWNLYEFAGEGLLDGADPSGEHWIGDVIKACIKIFTKKPPVVKPPVVKPPVVKPPVVKPPVVKPPVVKPPVVKAPPKRPVWPKKRRKKDEPDEKDDDGKGLCTPFGPPVPSPGGCAQCTYVCKGTRYFGSGLPIQRWQKGGCHGTRKWVYGFYDKESCEGNAEDGEPFMGTVGDDGPID